MHSNKVIAIIVNDVSSEIVLSCFFGIAIYVKHIYSKLKGGGVR